MSELTLFLYSHMNHQTLLALAVSASAGILAVVMMFQFARKKPLPATSKHPTFVLPKEVQSNRLLSHDPASCQLFYENLRRHSFAIIELDNRAVELLSNLEDAGSRFFQLPLDVKSRNRETGLGNNNIGYVNVEKVREYIKVCLVHRNSAINTLPPITI